MARYKMRQRLVSLGDDFTIENESGAPVFRVDGKVMSIRQTFVIEDLEGNEVATIRERKLALRESMSILRGGETVATIRKAWFKLVRDRFEIDIAGGDGLVAQGDLTGHEYEIRRGDTTVARVSKSWFSFRDTYGIETVPGQDDGLILAIAVAVDEMVHDDAGSGG